MQPNCTHAVMSLILTIAVQGCAANRVLQKPAVVSTLPAAEAPAFSLTDPDTGKISTVSHSPACKVTIVDRRQEFEKRYYPGTTDAHHWRDAMTVLPMEAFRPDLDKAILQQVQKNLPNAADFETIEIAVGAFHVALDERKRGENQLLSDYKKWDDQREEEEAAKEEKRLRDLEYERNERQRNAELGLSKYNDDTDDGVGSTLMGAVIRSAIIKPLKLRRTQAARVEQLKAAPQTLPVSLTAGKKSGWNCRLNAVVTLHSNTGEPLAIPVSVSSHVAKDDAVSVQEHVEQVVADALNMFGNKLRQPSL